MSWLSTFGKAVLTGAKIATGVQQSLQPVLPPKVNDHINDTLGLIVTAVSTAEVMVNAIQSGKTGAQKLQAATPIAMQIVLASPLMAKLKVKDADAFAKAVEGLTGNVADLLNACEAK